MQDLNRRQFLRRGGIATLTAGAIGALPGVALDVATAPPAGAVGLGTHYHDPVLDQGGQVYDVRGSAYGSTPAADGVRALSSGLLEAGTTRLTQRNQGNENSSHGAEVLFTAADVGKLITIHGAGPSGSVLTTTIAAFIDGNTIDIADPASTTVPATSASTDPTTNPGYIRFAYGTDQTNRIKSVITAAGATGTVFLPPGIYMITEAIEHTGRGGIRGAGGTSMATLTMFYRQPNTMLLSADPAGGLVLTGDAWYGGFVCNGNDLAPTPLQIGKVASNTVTSAPTNATFFDVWATASAWGATSGAGMSILGAKRCAFYECGSIRNGRDGVYIDGGSEDLVFVHFQEHSDGRYGIHGDHLVKAESGSAESTKHVVFYSGLCDGAGLAQRTLSKVYLRGAVDWRFPEMVIVGTSSGPTVHLYQGVTDSGGNPVPPSYGIDFKDCTIFADQVDGAADICIQVDGDAPTGVRRRFLNTGGCRFTQGTNSVNISGDPKQYEYTALGGFWDTTSAGVATATGLRAGETMFTSRTGKWQAFAATAPWTGNLSYRFMGEGWVEWKGNVKYDATATAAILNVPLGYRPAATRRIAVTTTSGAGVITFDTNGDVSAVPAAGGAFPANTTVYLDGVSFPVAGA